MDTCNPWEERLLRGFKEQCKLGGKAILKPRGILTVDLAGTFIVLLDDTSYPVDEAVARKGRTTSGTSGTT